MGRLSLELILSKVAQFLRNEAEYSGVTADRVIECRSGDSCTIIGCRNYQYCASSYRERRGGGRRGDQPASGSSRE
jgi:hypothetical protein